MSLLKFIIKLLSKRVHPEQKPKPVHEWESGCRVVHGLKQILTD